LNRPEAKTDKQAFDSYLINNVYRQQFGFDNNELYLDWNEMESYMLKVLDTIISKKDRKNLDLFIERSPEANASMDKFGFLHFNLGMIAVAQNEAELASVIGHEIGHYLLKHTKKHIGDFNSLQDYKGGYDLASLDVLYRKMRKYESQADSFSFVCMKNSGYSLGSTVNHYEMRDMKDRVFRNHISYANLTNISQMSNEELVKRSNKVFNEFDSHPLDIERYLDCRSAMAKCKSPVKNFIIDSVQFFRMKKIDREERKKINFDKCEYKECIEFCFIVYLYDAKKQKNLYVLCESLRRLLYRDPELAGKAFLAEDISDKKLFNYNKSILFKPDYIFENYIQYSELKDHSFFKEEDKPFNTYEEAFLFFSKEAIKIDLNEARFSLALHYFGKNRIDSTRLYLEKYIEKGVGQNIELAKDILDKEMPKSQYSKGLVVYNNTENYSGTDYNYYYTLQRKEENSSIKKVFDNWAEEHEIVFFNDLMGNKPNRLYDYQKLMSAIFSLFTKEEIDVLGKNILEENDSKKAKTMLLKKQKYLLVYAPEWYNWFKTEGFGKLYFTNIKYEYSNYFSDDDYKVNYTSFYLNFNDWKASFKNPQRDSKNRTEVEIAKDLLSFIKAK